MTNYDQLIDKLYGNYYDLEEKHNYIQWLFPISTKSDFNSHSQPLQEHEIIVSFIIQLIN
jgi:hypothetical protein